MSDVRVHCVYTQSHPGENKRILATRAAGGAWRGGENADIGKREHPDLHNGHSSVTAHAQQVSDLPE
jgi:hypothetical protein